MHRWRIVWCLFKGGIFALGLCSFVVLLFAFIGLPRPFSDWITARHERTEAAPAYMVVLGGGGIPSESGLIRTYYAAAAGVGMTGTTFIVSLPAAEDPEKESTGLMRDELVMRGIAASSIVMEAKAKNTYEQAHAIRTLLPEGASTQSLLVVTSPIHLRRSLLCFRAAGFENVQGLGSSSVGVDADIGKNVFFRYRLWTNLKNQVVVLRELTAMLVYKMRGWI